MSTTTPNLGLTLPTPNVDTGWGSTLNTDFTLLDNIFADNGSGTAVGINVGSGKTMTLGGTLILGTGDGTNTTAAPTIRGPARTGTNAAGSNLTIDASNGTGIGGSGKIILRTAPAGTSGVTANTMASVFEVNSAGGIGVSAANYGTAKQALLSGGPTGAANWGTVDGTVLSITSQAQGDILYRDTAAWARLAAGTSGQVLKTQGSGANPTWADNTVMQTAQNSTSGTSVNFTSIPSYVKRIMVAFNGVGTSGSTDFTLRIGDSGGLETSGYTGSVSWGGSGTTNYFSSSFIINNNVSGGNTYSGIATLVNVSGNIWVISGTLCSNTSGAPCFFGGTKTLSATLDRLSVLSGTLTAGSINIMYD